MPGRLERVARRIGFAAPSASLSRSTAHERVGGLWDQIGLLQFEYLVAQGLAPTHSLLDMGCGSLRGGIHFIRYLQAGHYCGVDINEKLIEAGRAELEHNGLADKRARLLVRGDFSVSDQGQTFDFALAQSLFTHLTFNRIVRCVAEVERVLNPGGRFYATFFANAGARLRVEPTPVVASDSDEGKQIYLDRNPFYYSPDIFAWLCDSSSLSCEYRGEWGHPRSQHMLLFTKAAPAAT